MLQELPPHEILESSFSPGPIATMTRFTPSATFCRSPSNSSGTNPKKNLANLRRHYPARRISYAIICATGAIGRFSPVMKSVEKFANSGGMVLGVCNGFQILCEAGLLPAR